MLEVLLKETLAVQRMHAEASIRLASAGEHLTDEVTQVRAQAVETTAAVKRLEAQVRALSKALKADAPARPPSRFEMAVGRLMEVPGVRLAMQGAMIAIALRLIGAITGMDLGPIERLLTEPPAIAEPASAPVPPPSAPPTTGGP